MSLRKFSLFAVSSACVERSLIMSIPKSVLSLVVLGAVVAPAFAGSDATLVDGEIGFIWHATPGGKSSDEVRKELQAFQANPVTADGYHYIGGELGYVYVGPKAGSGKSRDQVLKELQTFRANPVTADGYRYVGGEMGYVYVGPKATR